MNFFDDLAFGQIAEKALQHHLSLAGIEATQIDNHTCDLVYETKVEVKTDKEWQRTGNVAIEYRFKGEPSGISTTESTIYVYVLDGINSFWYCNTKQLRTFLKNTVCKRVKGGDNNMSDLILLTLSQFFSIFKRL